MCCASLQQSRPPSRRALHSRHACQRKQSCSRKGPHTSHSAALERPWADQASVCAVPFLQQSRQAQQACLPLAPSLLAGAVCKRNGHRNLHNATLARSLVGAAGVCRVLPCTRPPCQQAYRRSRQACWRERSARGRSTAHCIVSHQRPLWSAQPACAVRLPAAKLTWPAGVPAVWGKPAGGGECKRKRAPRHTSARLWPNQPACKLCLPAAKPLLPAGAPSLRGMPAGCSIF